jgi:hypothetical protein
MREYQEQKIRPSEEVCQQFPIEKPHSLRGVSVKAPLRPVEGADAGDPPPREPLRMVVSTTYLTATGAQVVAILTVLSFPVLVAFGASEVALGIAGGFGLVLTALLLWRHQ